MNPRRDPRRDPLGAMSLRGGGASFAGGVLPGGGGSAPATWGSRWIVAVAGRAKPRLVGTAATLAASEAVTGDADRAALRTAALAWADGCVLHGGDNDGDYGLATYPGDSSTDIVQVRKARKTIETCVIAYLLTGIASYLTRAKNEAVAYTTWNTWQGVPHLESASELTHATAFLLEWAPEGLTASQRTDLIAALRTKGLNALDAGFNDTNSLHRYDTNPGVAGSNPSNRMALYASAAAAGVACLAAYDPAGAAASYTGLMDATQRGMAWLAGRIVREGSWMESPGYGGLGILHSALYAEIVGRASGGSVLPEIADLGPALASCVDWLLAFTAYDGSRYLAHSQTGIVAEAQAFVLRGAAEWLPELRTNATDALIRRLAKTQTNQTRTHLGLLHWGAMATAGDASLEPKWRNWPGLGQFVWREAWSTAAMVFGFMAQGPYNQQKYKRGQLGSWHMEMNGEPVVVNESDYSDGTAATDAGAHHNVVRFGPDQSGMAQQPSKNTITFPAPAYGVYDAARSDPASGYATYDLTSAYPSQVSLWRRQARRTASNAVRITDRFTTLSGQTAWQWQLHTPCAVSFSGDLRTATLTRNGKSFEVRIVTSGLTFVNSSALRSDDMASPLSLAGTGLDGTTVKRLEIQGSSTAGTPVQVDVDVVDLSGSAYASPVAISLA